MVIIMSEVKYLHTLVNLIQVEHVDERSKIALGHFKLDTKWKEMKK